MHTNQQLVIAVVITLIVGLAAGFGAGLFAGKRISSSDFVDDIQQNSGSRTGDDSVPDTQPVNSLIVPNQPAGMSVSVEKAVLGEEGWVAIHDNIDGELGNILGAYKFKKGTTENGKTELLRATETGMLYFAVIHKDNDDGVFDHETDLPVKDAFGEVVKVQFAAL